jgi:hypothetical protein
MGSEPSFLAALGVVLEHECARDEKCKRRHLLVDVAVTMDERGLQFEGVTNIRPFLCSTTPHQRLFGAM